MSVLDRFEKSVEGAVNGVFAKFGSKDLKPVDLSSALEREIDKEAMPVTRDRTVAPNEYRFKLSTPDFNNIVEWGAETLANELADNLTQYAKSQNYAFVGPVVVIFEEDLELSKGDYRLSSESVQGNTVPVTTDAQTEDCPMLEIGEHQYLLTEEKTIIGRGSDCDIVIDDPGISRRHMEIDVTDNGNTVIARDLHQLEKIEDRIEALEDRVLAHELDDFSAPMTALRKETMAWFRYYSQLDDVACELHENENGFFTDSEQLMFRMFEDRVIRLREESQLLRESCAQLQSLFQAEIDTRQNRIMQILTIVTTIFLPLTLLVGWYGMNFVGMPELTWKYGYPVVVIVSIVTVGISLWVCKKKKFW